MWSAAYVSYHAFQIHVILNLPWESRLHPLEFRCLHFAQFGPVSLKTACTAGQPRAALCGDLAKAALTLRLAFAIVKF
jgi:hypothetical protein